MSRSSVCARSTDVDSGLEVVALLGVCAAIRLARGAPRIVSRRVGASNP